MPIYAYRCASCGHAKDVLQKMSDPLLSVCPACGASTFAKQLTAAGFQLKGSGWYVTDFRSGQNDTKKADAAADGAPSQAKPTDKDGAPAKPEAAPAPAASAAPAATPSTPATGPSGS